MFTNSGFGRTVDLLHRNLDVSTIRRGVIADNLANSDTPNFKRTELDFESSLKKALRPEPESNLQATMLEDKHIPFYRQPDWRDVKPHKFLDYLSTSKNNGNNVDVEEEMMMSTKNQMQYEIMTRSITGEFNLVNIVLRP